MLLKISMIWFNENEEKTQIQIRKTQTFLRGEKQLIEPTC